MRLPFTILFLVIACWASQQDERDIKVHIATWNVASQSPEGDLSQLLGVAESPFPDLIVLGLQEVTMRPGQAIINKIMSCDSWTKEVTSVLAQHGYEKIKTVRMVGIVMSVFAKYELAPSINNVATDKVPTGFAGLYGNKGAVMIAMDVGSSRLRLINSHLPAHDDKLKDRIQDYKWIREELSDSSPADYIFWFGDLNFRLMDEHFTSERIVNMIQREELDDLQKMDQLNYIMESDTAFGEFTEAQVKFKPTYKKLLGSSDYNTKRRPAWTDRILYMPNPRLQLSLYNSLDQYQTSDHCPVIAQFTLTV